MSHLFSFKTVVSIWVGSLLFVGFTHAGDRVKSPTGVKSVTGVKDSTGQNPANCSFLVKCANGYREDYNTCQCVEDTKTKPRISPKSSSDSIGGVKPVRTNPPMGTSTPPTRSDGTDSR